MNATSRFERLTVEPRGGVTVLSLVEMDIWDGTDLSLLRNALSRLIRREKCRSIGINMRRVQHVPTGFFGTLYGWHVRGVAVRLYSPHPRIRQMLWFRHFFEPDDFFQPDEDDGYVFCNTSRLNLREQPELKWYDQPVDDGRGPSAEG